MSAPRRYLPVVRFVLFNLAALASIAAAYVRGWVDLAVYRDHAGLAIAIAAVFLIGLGTAAHRSWAVARELRCIRDHGPCRRTLAARYLAEVAGRAAGARAIIASELRSNVANRMTVVRHFAAGLVLLGLIGTVLGLIVVFAGVDMAAAESVTAVGATIGRLTEGISLALHPALVGAILNLLLMANYYFVSHDAMRFVAEAVALGERNART